MSTNVAQWLWQQLQQRGLVEGDLPASPPGTSPWYVRTMMGAAGWIGALFLLGFVGAGFFGIWNSVATSLIVGVVLCAGAWLLFRIARASDFAAQFGLATSIAGQVLFIAGLFRAFNMQSPAPYLLIALFEAALVAMMPHFLHRLLSGWSAMLALALALGAYGMPSLAPGIAATIAAVIWLNETRWLAHDGLLRPLGYGITLALLQFEGLSLFQEFNRWMWSGSTLVVMPQYTYFIGAAMTGIVLLMTALHLLAREGIDVTSRAAPAAIGATLALAVLAAFAPGLASAVLILVLGFAAGNRILMGLAAVALLGFISHYYYQLDTTLLMKSLVLAVTGVVLVMTRLALNIAFPVISEKGSHHA